MDDVADRKSVVGLLPRLHAMMMMRIDPRKYGEGEDLALS